MAIDTLLSKNPFEYDYLLRISRNLNDEYLMITSSGWKSGIDVHFVFSIF